MATGTPFSFKALFSKDLITVAIFVSILTIIVVPLPKMALDMFLSISLSLSLLVLLISLYIQRPSDLTTFPTLILVFALFRLSLNIATTRSILSEGHNGPDAVSSIISSFGDFVVGGNLVIGIIVFIILVLINFIVVTKGATRVAEVSARFTLDSLPGKQMAIDADLNAGFIDEAEARKQREAVVGEANFYGAMDGSSKFVKGDAIAGIIITLVNMIGGLLIGIFQHNLDVGQSAEVYTILTIGDGLVSQIPALILSTATAIIITRSSRDADNFAAHSVTQLVASYKSLMLVGMGVILFGLLPGFPTGILTVLGLLFVSVGYILYMIDNDHENSLVDFFKKKEESPVEELPKVDEKPKEQSEEYVLDNIMKLEVLELRLGYKLLSFLQGNGDLLDKIKGIRKSIATDLGIVIPQIRIKDDADIDPSSYQLLLKRSPIAVGKVQSNKLLAMGGFGGEKIDGEQVKEPVFGLDATWINNEQKEDALMKGFTVVDSPTIISTHISETIQKYAEEIITRQDIVDIIEKLKQDYPIVVEEAMKVTSSGMILTVCKQLLHEKIPIIDMLTVIESISDIAEYTKSPEILLEHVRARLFRLITDRFKGEDGVLHIMTLKPELEQHLSSKLKEEGGVTQLLLTIGEINNLVTNVQKMSEDIKSRGIDKIALVVDPVLRKRLSEIFEKFAVSIPVLSHAELDSSASFTIEGSVEAI